MGVAAGKDARGLRSFAMLIAKGSSRFTAVYSYRWSQARADGAGTHTYRVSRPDARTVTFGQPSMSGTTLIVPIVAPRGISLSCALSQQVGHGWTRARFRRCGTRARFHGVRPGTYRVSVRSVLGVVSTILTVT